VTEEGLPSPSRRARELITTVGIYAAAAIIAIPLQMAKSGVGPFRPSASTIAGTKSPTTEVTPSTSGAPPTLGGPTLTVVDDFSDRSSGWADENDAFYDGDGGYRIRLSRDHTYRAIGPRATDPSVASLVEEGVGVRVEVDAKVFSPTLTGRGLFCRRGTGEKEQYQGVLYSDGRWVITRNRTGASTTLASGTTTLPVADFQHIGFDCSDGGGATTMRFRLGAETLGEAADPGGLKGGLMGVVAATANASGGEVVFDNFVAARL